MKRTGKPKSSLKSSALDALLSKPTISPDELYRSGIFPLSRNGIYAAIERGEIEAIKFGRKKAIIMSALRKRLGL